MLPFPLLGPVEAEVGFGGAPVGPEPTVERALPPIIQVPAGGDHLGPEGPGGLAVDLAEVGRQPAPHQGFEFGLLR